MAAWDIRGAYAVAVAASAAAFLLVLAIPDLTAHHERAGRGLERRTVSSVLLEHRRIYLGTGILAIAAARGARTSLLPLWAENIGLSATDTSLVFGIAGALDMLLFYPAGAVMDRFGRAWIAVPTVVVLGLGMMALPLTHSMLTLTVVALVMALGNGIGSGIVMTLGADAAPADARPQFLGGWRLFADFGLSAGPLLVSAITLVAPSRPPASRWARSRWPVAAGWPAGCPATTRPGAVASRDRTDDIPSPEPGSAAALGMSSSSVGGLCGVTSA